MAYRFLKVIESIDADLSNDAVASERELGRINARRAEIEAELEALQPRQLRANRLKSHEGLICADCFILDNVETLLTPVTRGTQLDLFRYRECGAEIKLKD